LCASCIQALSKVFASSLVVVSPSCFQAWVSTFLWFSFLGQHIAIAHFFDFFSCLAHCPCHNKHVAMTMTLMWKVVLVVDMGVYNQIFWYLQSSYINLPTRTTKSKLLPISTNQNAFQFSISRELLKNFKRRLRF